MPSHVYMNRQYSTINGGTGTTSIKRTILRCIPTVLYIQLAIGHTSVMTHGHTQSHKSLYLFAPAILFGRHPLAP